jgi:hypothetical protein
MAAKTPMVNMVMFSTGSSLRKRSHSCVKRFIGNKATKKGRKKSSLEISEQKAACQNAPNNHSCVVS